MAMYESGVSALSVPGDRGEKSDSWEEFAGNGEGVQAPKVGGNGEATRK